MENAPLTTVQLELIVNAAVEDFLAREWYLSPITCSHDALEKIYHPNHPTEDSLLRVFQGVLVLLPANVRDYYTNPSEAVHDYISQRDAYTKRRTWEESPEGREERSLQDDLRDVGNACSYFTREGTRPSLLTRRSLGWVLDEIRKNLLPYDKGSQKGTAHNA